MKCEDSARLDRLVCEILTTLKLNLLRGTLTTEDDAQFKSILARWDDSRTPTPQIKEQTK